MVGPVLTRCGKSELVKFFRQTNRRYWELSPSRRKGGLRGKCKGCDERSRSNPLSKPPGLLLRIGPVLTRRGKNELVKFFLSPVPTQQWLLEGRKLDIHDNDTLAERFKVVAQGAIPEGRGFEPHRYHFEKMHSVGFSSPQPRVSAIAASQYDRCGCKGIRAQHRCCRCLLPQVVV